MEQKYFKVSKIAQIFDLKPAVARQFCHAKGQRFAFQPIKGGNIYIDLKKFEDFLKSRNSQGGQIR